MLQNFFSKRKFFFRKNANKGFSFLEALISIAVFTIIMIATVEVFSSMIQTKAEADRMRESHQKAQVAIETITKSIRSGVVVSPTTGYASQNTIRIYDFSQSQCIEYNFSGTVLQKQIVGMDVEDRNDCATATLGGAQIMVDATVRGIFDIFWDEEYVTITLLLVPQNQEAFSNQTRVQTTVSMRNLK
jgi:type II secretory pathway pseudopilin PulG